MILSFKQSFSLKYSQAHAAGILFIIPALLQKLSDPSSKNKKPFEYLAN